MPGLLVQSFEGFEAADFEAFRPDKWRSNKYNLERMRAHQRLEALGQALQPTLTDAGFPLDLAVTSERPSLWNQHTVSDLWLYLLRPAEHRKRIQLVMDKGRTLARAVDVPAEHRLHVHLGIRLDLVGIEVGLVLPEDAWVDRENAAASLASAEGLAEAESAVANLPEDLILEKGPIRLVRRYTRETPVVGQAAFIEELRELLLRMLDVYRLLAWRPDHDMIQLESRVAEERAAVEEHAAAASAARKASEEAIRSRAEEARSRTTERDRARREAEEAFKRLAGPPPAATGMPKTAPRSSRPARGAPRPDKRGRGQRQGGAREQRSAKKAPVFSSGDEVILKRGLLEGKAGVIVATEDREVRVKVGGLEVRISVWDVEAG